MLTLLTVSVARPKCHVYRREIHLHLDGRETGWTVGRLALDALETRFAVTTAQIITLCGL